MGYSFEFFFYRVRAIIVVNCVCVYIININVYYNIITCSVRIILNGRQMGRWLLFLIFFNSPPPVAFVIRGGIVFSLVQFFLFYYYLMGMKCAQLVSDEVFIRLSKSLNCDFYLFVIVCYVIICYCLDLFFNFRYVCFVQPNITLLLPI